MVSVKVNSPSLVRLRVQKNPAKWSCSIGRRHTGVVNGQPISEKPPIDAVTIEDAQNRLKQLDASPELTEDNRHAARELLQKALPELESANAWRAKADHFEQMAASAPAELEQTRADLASLPTRVTPAIPDDVALPKLELVISKKETDLKETKKLLAELEAEPKRRASRRTKLPKLLAAAGAKIADLDKQIQAPSSVDEPPPLAVFEQSSERQLDPRPLQPDRGCAPE